MYLDCQTCGFESKHFGLYFDFANDELIKKFKEWLFEEGKGEITPNGSSGFDCAFTCPNGHKLDLLPSTFAFMKKYKYPT